ncbi:MAG: Mg2 transporter protein CorA family protein [Parcubacteria group bacterium GW2011_GWA2_38_13]|nr:MAG: Mg2 transporter protein CorA family protein [Parcubacteria group bacterium GW2011_GWA2_38_13]
MANIRQINFKNIIWMDFINPKENDINHLRENFNFHPLNIQDCMRDSHRSEINLYDDYIFLVMLFPVYNRATREITHGEIKFFITRNHLITIHHRDFGAMEEFFKILEIGPSIRTKFSDESPEQLLFEILNKLFLYCFPMVDHLIIDCDVIEKAIFTGKEKQMVSEILLIRRNITDFRKIMQVHKSILKKLIFTFKVNTIFNAKKTEIYFENLIDYSKEIWDTLENLKERIEALQDTNESQISFRLSTIMKTLTIISVITFPLTLIATLFSMAFTNAPLRHNPYGFWIIVCSQAIIAGGMLWVFKNKKWF